MLGSGWFSQTQPMPKQMGQFLSMVLRGAFVQSFLQLFFRLVIELLVAALRLTGLLPELICAADNINFSGLAHWRLSLRSGCDDFRRSLTRRDVRPKWFVAPTGAR